MKRFGRNQIPLGDEMRRRLSQTMAAATAALSDSAPPNRGIVTKRLTLARTGADKPRPSLPMATIASRKGCRLCTSSPVKSQPRTGTVACIRRGESAALKKFTRLKEAMLAWITF